MSNDKRKTKVYITNFYGHDYTGAKKFGELEPITFGYTKIDNFNSLKLTIAAKLVDSHEDDWLCLSGMALLCTLCSIIWLNKHGKIKLLIWERKGKNEDELGVYRKLIITNESMDTLLDMAAKGKAE